MKYTFLILISFFAHTSFSYGQEPLNLEQCIDMAWERNLDLKSSSYLLHGSTIDLKQAKQARLPNLNGNARLGLNLGKTIDPTSNDFINTSFLSNNYGLSSNISIYNYNRINNIIKQSRLSKSSKEHDYEQLRMDIALRVTTAYVNTLFAQENLKNAEVQLATSKSQLSRMDILIKTGTRPSNDRLDLVAAVAVQEQKNISFQNQYELSNLNLKQLLRLDYNDELEIEQLTETTINSDVETTTIEALVANVLSRYPALQSAAINTSIAGVQIDVAKASMYPSISAGVSLGSNYSNQGKKIGSSSIVLNEQPVFINGESSLLGVYSRDVVVEDNPYLNQISENVSYGFGVSMSIPIYNNYRSKGNVAHAKIALLQAENNYERIKDQLILSLQQVLSDARMAKKEMMATETSLKATKAAYESAQKKSTAGAISTFEYLLVKDQMDSAQLQSIIAKYNYIFKVKLLDYYLGVQ